MIKSSIIKTLKRPRIMPYGFKLDPIAHKLCMDWCIKEFGHFKRDGRDRWTHRRNSFMTQRGNDIGHASIYFMNIEDAVAFKLRWM